MGDVAKSRVFRLLKGGNRTVALIMVLDMRVSGYVSFFPPLFHSLIKGLFCC